MDPIDRSSRTWLCTVVFVDIVKYTNHPVSRQIGLKERMNAFIAEAIDHVAPNERVILDTGDGAALCFMGDPEDAFFAAIDILNAFERERQVDPAANLRIGSHLGPVKIVKDLNQHHNIIGEAINVAQRIMSFSEPNQMLVSRSFHEVISPLSREHARLFQYLGTRKDKHVREHAVYEVLLAGQEPAPTDASSDSTVAMVSEEDTIAIETHPTMRLEPDVSAALERELAFYMGPLAKILVKRASGEATSVRHLCELLAAHLTNQNERETFLTNTGEFRAKDTLKGSDQERSAASTESAPDPPALLDPRALREVETLLATHVGPVARILVRREQQPVTDLDELYRRLASHITDATDRDAFVQALKKARTSPDSFK